MYAIIQTEAARYAIDFKKVIKTKDGLIHFEEQRVSAIQVFASKLDLKVELKLAGDRNEFVDAEAFM